MMRFSLHIVSRPVWDLAMNQAERLGLRWAGGKRPRQVEAPPEFPVQLLISAETWREFPLLGTADHPPAGYRQITLFQLEAMGRVHLLKEKAA